ncbi:phytanoyl-CoA dioxygenase family protein [Oxynema aestuarii]|uniref:UbiA family prenyltransferase n=1 Tax=Oxynema aestuarii AP17 TaxID=2064643 RepID=A0A6H1U529_9CYAN|nr:phytanoyl-CoA dioxygenase family protein [Oxynema aestuarii]QIZ73477.1 UbiA family prenyltransferase [Oxynema aestuarii AP17]
MNEDNVLNIYDQNYAQNYNQRFLLNDLSKIDADFERETIAQLLNEIGDHPRWLDVACGTGYFLSCFPEVERSGLDISPAMLETARQANPKIPLIQGDYRDKRPEWKGKWDLVSCMWLAYGYVESLSELDRVVENFANWTSDRGICFVPFTAPQELATGELHIPYECKNLYNDAGFIRFEAVVWTWVDEEMEKQHRNMLAPQLEYMLALFGRYFEKVEVIEYPLVKGARRKAIVARQKKYKTEQKQTNFTPLKLIRSQEWWLYKIAPLLTIAYAETLLLQLSPTTATLTTLTALLSIASVAAYGYLLNDICDIETDQKANKPNAAAQLQPWQRLLLCLLFLSIGFAAPLLTHLGTIPLALLAANYLLPTLYSVPPLRLKERGIWGILSDAAGAHLVPTLFVAATVLSQTPDPPRNALIFTAVAAAHAFFVGLRGILLHQLWDRANDLNSGITTFVSQRPPETVQRWINRLVFPVEIALLGSIAILLSGSAPLLLVFFIVYLLVIFGQVKFDQVSLNPSPLSPPVKQNIIPHDLYEVWLPLALAILLSSRNPYYLSFVVMTLILFFPSVKNRAIGIVNVIKSVFTLGSRPTPSTTEAPRPTPTNVTPLTPAMQQQLETEGYVVLENFLTPDELEDLRELVSTDPLPENADNLSSYTLFSKSDPVFRQHHSDRLKAIVNPKLTPLLPNHRAAFCTWYRKSPNSAINATPLHQDPSLTDETETLSYGIWCPLMDVTPENGCLSVVKGSHPLNSKPRPFYPFSPFPYDSTLASLIQDRYLTPIPLKAGQAILYDRRLFHGASPNTQDRERVALTCIIALQNTLTHFAYLESAESETLECFAVEDDFYNRYIWGEKPQGDGVTLIKTEPYTYDRLTPELIAEKLDPLHPDRAIPRLKTQLAETQTHLEQSRSQRQQELTASNQQLHQKTTELATLKQDYSQTQAELEHLREQLQTTQTQHQQTQAELERDRTQLQQTQAELERDRTQLQQTQAELEQSQEQLQQTQIQLQISERQQQQMQAILEESQAELSEKTGELNQIKSEQHRDRLAEIIRRRFYTQG